MTSNYGWHWVLIWLIVFYAGYFVADINMAWGLPIMVVACLLSRYIFAKAVNAAEKGAR